MVRCTSVRLCLLRWRFPQAARLFLLLLVFIRGVCSFEEPLHLGQRKQICLHSFVATVYLAFLRNYGLGNVAFGCSLAVSRRRELAGVVCLQIEPDYILFGLLVAGIYLDGRRLPDLWLLLDKLQKAVFFAI